MHNKNLISQQYLQLKCVDLISMQGFIWTVTIFGNAHVIFTSVSCTSEVRIRLMRFTIHKYFTFFSQPVLLIRHRRGIFIISQISVSSMTAPHNEAILWFLSLCKNISAYHWNKIWKSTLSILCELLFDPLLFIK